MKAARPAEAYVHGVDGAPVVVITGRVAAWLARHVDLDRVRINSRGTDPEVDAQLVALAVAAAAWRARRGISTDTGTTSAWNTEHAAQSPQELSTTQAARRLGISSRGVRQALERGRLPGRTVGGRWVIDAEDLEHYRT